MNKKLLLLMPIVLLTYVFFHLENYEASTTLKQVTNINKSWTVTFNQSLDRNSISDTSVYVTRQNGGIHQVTIDVIGTNRIVITPKQAFNLNETYQLHIKSTVRSIEGERLKNDVIQPFKIEPLGQYIHSVNAVPNPFVSNFIVHGHSSVTRVDVVMPSGHTSKLDRYHQSFRNGKRGLSKGQKITIKAYNASNQLLESIVYTIE